MKEKLRGFGVVEILIVVAIIGLASAVGWLVYNRTTENGKTSKSQKTDETTAEKIQVKGSILIYNPEDPAPTLEGQVFDPNVWYVNPREVKWPGTKETNYKLDLTSATCSYPDTDTTDRCDNSEVIWDYGDRVTVDGLVKDNRTLKVDKMIVVSAQPVKNW